MRAVYTTRKETRTKFSAWCNAIGLKDPGYYINVCYKHFSVGCPSRTCPNPDVVVPVWEKHIRDKINSKSNKTKPVTTGNNNRVLKRSVPNKGNRSGKNKTSMTLAVSRRKSAVSNSISNRASPSSSSGSPSSSSSSPVAPPPPPKPSLSVATTTAPQLHIAPDLCDLLSSLVKQEGGTPNVVRPSPAAAAPPNNPQPCFLTLTPTATPVVVQQISLPKEPVKVPDLTKLSPLPVVPVKTVVVEPDLKKLTPVPLEKIAAVAAIDQQDPSAGISLVLNGGGVTAEDVFKAVKQEEGPADGLLDQSEDPCLNDGNNNSQLRIATGGNSAGGVSPSPFAVMDAAEWFEICEVTSAS